LRSGAERRILPLRIELQDLIAREHQFAHQVHQLVQQTHGDPDVGVRDGRIFRGIRFGFGAGGLRWRWIGRGYRDAGRAVRRRAQASGEIFELIGALLSAGFDRGENLARRIDGF
jgi:hypothetical protein